LNPSDAPRKRLAFIISHPIQYYAPLHQRLAGRGDLDIKVFFTWHSGETAQLDRGFGRPVSWDIPLTEGYDWELVPNIARRPGTHRFFGLRNPELVGRVLAWRPDAVHVTGWAWASHLHALWALSRRGTPCLFRGDSHLLDDDRHDIRWRVKQSVLSKVFSWPRLFLATGQANRAYYRAFGVEDERITICPHSIDVARFKHDAEAQERRAAEWRASLGIGPDQVVLLYAGKFERKKAPLELMRAIAASSDDRLALVMVGDGELRPEIEAIAGRSPARFRILPFQNQRSMPVVYRLGDLFVLPSAYGETWGLAVNEALACGRPVLVSDHVGCAEDVVDDRCGRIFQSRDPGSLGRAISAMTEDAAALRAMRPACAARADLFDVPVTEMSLLEALKGIAW
jgi:glycosyltransferase involved in cell wall biosynthesis